MLLYDTTNKKKNIFRTITILVIALLSVLYLRFAWNRYQDISSSEALMLAHSLKSLLHYEHIAELSGNIEDLKKPEYDMIKLSLTRLVETANPVRFAYLLGERDGSIIILIDSESPDSADYSPPGQIYEEADDILWEPFKSGETVLTKPISDRWGTWISALVPIKEPSSGKVVAVLGLDYSASLWQLHVWGQMIPDLIIVFCVLLLVFALLRSHEQQTILKNLSNKLAFDEALYRSVFDQAPIGIGIVNDKNFVIQPEFGQISINPMFERILGRMSCDLESIKWPDITHSDDLKIDLEKFELFKTGKIDGYSMEKRFIRPDGSIVWTNMKISHLFGSLDKNSLHLCLLEDISMYKATEEALRESERSKGVLLSHLPGLAYRCNYDCDWTMQYVSAGCFELTGYKPESLLNNRDLSYNDLITPEYRELLWNEWRNILAKRMPFKYEYEIMTVKGERKWVLEMGQGIYNKQGEVEALEGIILDISDRKRMEDQLKHTSEHDMLTGLYNRRYLENILAHDAYILSTDSRAVVSINLSTMHSLSLAYGFHYSQALFKKIAEALKTYCNDNCQLFNTYEYRLVIYIKSYKDKNELSAFCKAIADKLEAMLAIERIGGGIGVVEIGEDNGNDIDQLLKNLLIASEKAINYYETKIDICFFDKEMEIQVVRENEISRELAQIASGNDVSRLFLQFQPILGLGSNKISGFEALARLESNKFGRIPPLEFIPIAEKTKLIIPLGNEILRQAFNFLNTLKANGYDEITLSVNISAIQLLRNDFSENLIEMAKAMQINLENITLEITESVFASNYQEINNILGKLKQFGLKIAIDDFGTGYSSLARERELSVNILKIDKFFIDKLLVLKPEETITSDIISMAHKLGHCAIAEGVEHEKQMHYLKEHGCDKIQGYLVSKPLDESVAIELLRKYNHQ